MIIMWLLVTTRDYSDAYCAIRTTRYKENKCKLETC